MQQPPSLDVPCCILQGCQQQPLQSVIGQVKNATTPFTCCAVLCCILQGDQQPPSQSVIGQIRDAATSVTCCAVLCCALLCCLLQGDQQQPSQSVIDQVRDAATSWGFFQLVNHGVSQQLLDQHYEFMKRWVWG